MFAFRVFYYNLNKNVKIPPDNPKIGNELVQLIKMGSPFGINGLKVWFENINNTDESFLFLFNVAEVIFIVFLKIMLCCM